MPIIPVVLCGGSGTRLWPLSRKDFAKQHAAVLGAESPFQGTLRRAANPATFGRPIVLTGAGGRFMTADQAAAVGLDVDLVVEPEGRDTLASIAAAVEIAARRDPAAVLLVLPSDHLIPDVAAFEAAARQAADAATQEDRLVVFGLKPDRPATGYGYIRPGAALPSGAHAVDAFVEKPDAARAAALIAEGCLWNSGMFCFTAGAARDAVARCAPQTAEIVAAAVEAGVDDLGAFVLGEGYRQAPKISFDYGVMEKTDRAAVVPAAFAWSDIGDWREVWAHAEKDGDGVALSGAAVARDCHDSYIRADDRLVCAVGVEGLAIIETADAVLVAPLDRAQEVKQLVVALEAAGRPEATEPARVHRPWGWYQTMDLGDRFRVKRIMVRPGKKLSLQKHHHRAEHWIVVRGTAEVTRDHEVVLLRENESIFMPLGCVHRLANPGKIPVEIIEVQTGSYLEEDDIIRFDDDFGRR